MFFWITLVVLMCSAVCGYVNMLELYDRLGGGGRPVGDLDRLVRESW